MARHYVGNTVPKNPTELAETLADPERAAAAFGGTAEGWRKFNTLYAAQVGADDPSIAEQVAVETQRVLAQFLRANGDTRRINLDPSEGPARPSALYNKRAPGAALDSMFERSGDYFRAIWHNTRHDQDGQAQLLRLRNFGSTVPSEGGFLVPERLRADLLTVSLETSIVRPRARVIPMDSARVPFPAIDATSNVGSVLGGVVGYWTEEGATLTPSEPKFGRVVLDAKKLTIYSEVPNELVNDAAGTLSAFIDSVLPEAVSFYEDRAFINGTGVGEPAGFLGGTASIEVAKEVGQVADTIVWENIVKMFARMLPGSLARAVWIASVDTFPELATMALSVGTGGGPVWINNGQEGPPMRILGRPVFFTEKTPVLGDAGDINFVDLGMYLLGDRQVMEATSSEHYKFQNDLTAYRIIERVDGRPWINSAITPANNGPSLSPFVKLAARA